MASIQLERVSVAFPIYNGRSRSLKNRVLAATTGGRIGRDAHNYVSIQALDEVSLVFEHGDRVGLVGHNGAGKTTLLRVLAGIYEPPSGKLKIAGNVAPLFDIGLGLDVKSTGYENIILRGLYLGLSRSGMRAKTEEIAAFSELGECLDLPLRTYSAGMYARLAFAISTFIEPDILLLDEGLGISDPAFLAKARRCLTAFMDRAGIVVLASHQEALLREVCTKAVLMKHGRVAATGGVDEILALVRPDC